MDDLNSLVLIFLSASFPTRQSGIIALPQTYAELSVVKGRFRPHFDADTSDVKVTLTDKRFVDLTYAIQSTAMLMQSDEPGGSTEAVIAKYSLLPVLTDFALAWIKAAKYPKDSDGILEFKRACKATRVSYRTSWEKLDLNHLTAEKIWHSSVGIRRSLSRLTLSVDSLMRWESDPSRAGL